MFLHAKQPAAGNPVVAALDTDQPAAQRVVLLAAGANDIPVRIPGTAAEIASDVGPGKGLRARKRRSKHGEQQNRDKPHCVTSL
jgi:hypothetical protein